MLLLSLVCSHFNLISPFGVNLYEVGLASKVEDYFEKMCAGTGAVSKIIAGI